MSDQYYTSLRARIGIVYEHGDLDENGVQVQPWRYVPVLADRADRSWHIYDRKQKRVLQNYEIAQVPLESVAQEMHYDA